MWAIERNKYNRWTCAFYVKEFEKIFFMKIANFSHRMNKIRIFILIEEKSWKIFLFLLVLWFWFFFIVFCDSKKFILSSFFYFTRKKKANLKGILYFCSLFSFDVEVDTNSILLSRCLLDRINIVAGVYIWICQVFAYRCEKDNLTSWRS